MNPYSYPQHKFQADLKLKQTTPRWWRYAVSFPTAHPTRYPENNAVRGEYFQPRQTDDTPLAILLHGMGDESLIPCQLLARVLVKQGIACFLLYSVFHSRRMPETVRQRLPDLTPEEWFEGYQISVIDVRQVIDWANSRAELNKEQIAVIGISFGGFISAIAMGVDNRIKAGIFITVGGNSVKIGQKSRKRAMKKRYQHSEAEYNHRQDRYARYLTEVAEKGIENVLPPSQSFLVDPLTFATYLRGRSVLMLNALWDEYIPKEAALDFWVASGKPAIVWLPASHATIWLWYPWIRREITRFLRSTFNRHPQLK